ncbi:hypothetical protein [Actinomyces urogenitalis]|uniref:hypothetical protein n=1 Tax=Actinomyces urogenitalis TaxID=103621 RepID=UPI00290B48B4|nr:hypothetical protein [Actinomyces urogenitalis]MDU5428095.1 hypothetical protein [Actinomyces urogenitalis]
MTTPQRALDLLPAVAGGSLVGTVSRVLARSPRLEAVLERENFHGRRVSLRGGLAMAAGTTAVGLLAARPVAQGEGARVAQAAALGAAVATTAAGAAGLVDDLDQGAHDGEAPAKGLKGHLGALARGRVTTGALKILVIGAGSAVAGAVMTAADPRPHRGLGGLVDAGVRTVAIASWANVHNLLDLRPGRALKAAGLLAAPMALTQARRAPASAALAGGTLACCAAGLREDLAEQTMLGDTGANTVGALAGASLASHPSPVLRLTSACAGTALVLASEKISFSGVIARTPALAVLDALGRRED